MLKSNLITNPNDLTNSSLNPNFNINLRLNSSCYLKLNVKLHNTYFIMITLNLIFKKRH